MCKTNARGLVSQAREATRMWLEHGGLLAGPCGRPGACFVPTALVEAAVLWDVGENKEWLW